MHKTTHPELEKLFKKFIPTYKTHRITERRESTYFQGYTLLTGQVYTEGDEVFDFTLPMWDGKEVRHA